MYHCFLLHSVRVVRVAVMDAIFMERCSWLQQERRRRSRRRLADPLSTNNMKGAHAGSHRFISLFFETSS